jgi:hypothetical protein
MAVKIKKVVTTDVPCPFCGSSTGWPCRTLTGQGRGREMKRPHKQRIKLVFED